MKIFILACIIAVVAGQGGRPSNQYIPPPIPQLRSSSSIQSASSNRVSSILQRPAAPRSSSNLIASAARPIPSIADSATQGPSPEDIATPEPEYIDIDLPPSGLANIPASLGPAPVPRSQPASVNSLSADGYRYRTVRRRKVLYRRKF